MENRQFSDATIHTLTEAGRVRLGIVTGKATEVFTFEWIGVRDLRVEIDMLAGDTYVTQALTVTPGDRLRLFVERPVQRSVLER